MSETNRRSVLQLVLAAPIAACWVPPPAFASTPIFAPPAGPMRFRRTLERELNGSDAIRVTRAFTISFTRQADEFLVDGSQSGVSVEAPPNLSALARIEEDRVETSLFPLMLDGDGIVTGLAAQPVNGQADDAAFSAASAQIAQMALAEGDRRDLQQLIAAVHQTSTSSTSQMPANLFAPPSDGQLEEQQLALPNGQSGRVSSLFGGSRNAETGVMERATREVVTQIGAERRRSLESWDLSKA